MGIAIGIGIAVIGFVILQRGGLSFGGGLTARSIPPTTGTYSNFQGSNAPSTISSSPYFGSAAVAAGANIASAAVAFGASRSSGDTGDSGSSSGTASAITAGIGAVAGVVSALLAAHQARLKGATNENNAALAIVPTYDSFISQLVSSVNSGAIPKSQAIGALVAFDQSIYSQLKSLIGAPGTAWSDSAGMNGQCDRSCTVGCCLYYSDLGPPLSLLRLSMGDPTGRWGAGDPRYHGNTVTVGAVNSGKYSSYSRPAYNVTISV